MKFDYIVGNPPYDINGKGQKIYPLISRKCIDLLAEDGIIDFITPASILKDSSNFNILGIKGLKTVNFEINKYFNVGVDIISWCIDKTYVGDITITHKDGTITNEHYKTQIFEKNTDKETIKIYQKLKKIEIKDRMFFRNNIGPTRSSVKNLEYIYSLKSYSRNNTKNEYFIKKKPYAYRKSKIIIPLSKSLSSNVIVIDVEDYNENYVSIDSCNIDNIKSFVLSKSFSLMSEKNRRIWV